DARRQSPVNWGEWGEWGVRGAGAARLLRALRDGSHNARGQSSGAIPGNHSLIQPGARRGARRRRESHQRRKAGDRIARFDSSLVSGSGAGTGSELRRPLGITIVGGLSLSQVLTLYTTPVIYLAFDRVAQRLKRARGIDNRQGERLAVEELLGFRSPSSMFEIVRSCSS